MAEVLKCPDWRLQIALLRVLPGSEIEVKTHCKEHAKERASYYKCLGLSDIVEFMYGDNLEPVTRHYSCNSILQTTVLSAFTPDQDLSGLDFIEWLDGAPCLILSRVKINPRLQAKLLLNGEIICTQYLASALHEVSPKVFFTLAHRELVVIFKDTGFENITRIFTDFRRKTLIKDLFDSEKYEVDISDILNEPVFVRTSTFPLISYDVIENNDYEVLTGKINPFTLLRCYPNEEQIIQTRVPNDYTLRPLWGDYDLVISAEDMELKQFVSQIMDLRYALRADTHLYSTCTFPLGSSERCSGESSKCSKSDIKANSEVTQPKVIMEFRQIIDEFVNSGFVDSVEGWLKFELSNFINKLHDCINDPFINLEYVDISQFMVFITKQIKIIVGTSDPQIRISLHERCSYSIAIATQALYHRFASIEAHFQGSSYPVFSPVIGSNRIMSAMGNLPRYIIDEKFSGERTQSDLLGKKWFGFVAAGPAFEFVHYHGEIITYPERALFEPFKQWQVVTHELAHLYIHLANLEQKIKESIRTNEYVGAYREAVKNSTLKGVLEFIEELFAHWFDYVYFYSGNLGLYLTALWNTWLEVPIVWKPKEKDQYLVRTLLIWLYGKNCLSKKDGRLAIDLNESIIANELDKLLVDISNKCEGFAQYLVDIKGDQKLAIVYKAKYWVFLLSLFEQYFWKPDLKDAINEDYPEIGRHIEQINNGIPVTEEITNPKQLLFSLLEQYINIKHEDINLSIMIAFILSFSNDYRRRIWREHNG